MGEKLKHEEMALAEQAISEISIGITCFLERLRLWHLQRDCWLRPASLPFLGNDLPIRNLCALLVLREMSVAMSVMLTIPP